MTALSDLIAADGPTLLWPMQEASGNAIDASGNGRDGTASGITYQAAGPEAIPYSYSFDAGDYVRRAADSAIKATGPISMGGWFYGEQSSTANPRNMLGQPHSSHGSPYYTNIWQLNSATFSYYLTPGAQFVGATTSAISLATMYQNWNFIVTTWDMETVRWYRNGAFVTQIAHPSAGAGGSISESTQTWGVGHANPNLAGATFGWAGRATHVFLFSGVRLSPAQISDYYQASL